MKSTTSHNLIKLAYVFGMVAIILAGLLAFRNIGPFGLSPITAAILACISMWGMGILFELAIRTSEKESLLNNLS